MSTVNLIHKSDVYFNVLKTLKNKGTHKKKIITQMRHGDIYIYLNRIYLRYDKHWYKADIEDILDIKTILSSKQIHIHFWNYDMVLFCKEYSHLSVLRDFLNLSQNYYMSNKHISADTKRMGGSSVH